MADIKCKYAVHQSEHIVTCQQLCLRRGKGDMPPVPRRRLE